MKKYFIFGAIILFVLLMTNSCIFVVDEIDGTLRIVNDSDGTYDLDISWVYIKESNESDWGGDRLGANSISPGETWTIDLAEGTYDVWIIDSYFDPDLDDYYAYGVDINSDSTTTLIYTGDELSK